MNDSRKPHKILFVDDDVNILQAYKRQFRKSFHVDIASHPEKGLAAVSNDGPYAVIVSDFRMPGMDGNQMLARVKEIAPETARILLTGHADVDTAMNAVNQGHIFRLLTKPCAPDRLEEALLSGIDQHLAHIRTMEGLNEGAEMQTSRRILVVDDDPAALDLLTRGLRTVEGLSVLTAENGKEAMSLLVENPVDLLLTDLSMPVVSGGKLIAFAVKQYPELPVIVLTGFGTDAIEKKIGKIRQCLYFEKPLDIALLVDVILSTLKEQTYNRIRGISLAALLQVVESEKKTCTLVVRSGGNTGKLYLVNGRLIAAETNSLQAEAAALVMLGWDDPVVDISDTCPKKEKEITQSLISLLLDSARAMDEEAA